MASPIRPPSRACSRAKLVWSAPDRTFADRVALALALGLLAGGWVAVVACASVVAEVTG